MDIISGKGPSVGIVCSGIKLSYKIVSAKSNGESYKIIPSTQFNVSEFNKKEFSYDTVIKSIACTFVDLILPEHISTDINHSKMLLRSEITSIIQCNIKCHGLCALSGFSCCSGPRLVATVAKFG